MVNFFIRDSYYYTVFLYTDSLCRNTKCQFWFTLYALQCEVVEQADSSEFSNDTIESEKLRKGKSKQRLFGICKCLKMISRPIKIYWKDFMTHAKIFWLLHPLLHTWYTIPYYSVVNKLKLNKSTLAHWNWTYLWQIIEAFLNLCPFRS